MKENFDLKLILLENSKTVFSPVFDTQNFYLTHPRSQNSEHLLNKVVVKQTLYNGGNYELKVLNGSDMGGTLAEPVFQQAKYNTSLTYSQPLLKNFKINTDVMNVLDRKNELEIAEIDDMIDTEKKIDNMTINYLYLAFYYEAFKFLKKYETILKNSKIDYKLLENTIVKLYFGKILDYIGFISGFKKGGYNSDGSPRTTLSEKIESTKLKIKDYSNKLKIFFDDRSTLEDIITDPFNVNEIGAYFELNSVIKFTLDNLLDIKKKRKEIEKLDIEQKGIRNDTLPEIKLNVSLNSDKSRFINNGSIEVKYDGRNASTQKNMLKISENEKKKLERNLKDFETEVINKKRKILLELNTAKRNIDRIKNVIKQNSEKESNLKLKELLQLILKYQLSYNIFKYQIYLHDLKKIYNPKQYEEYEKDLKELKDDLIELNFFSGIFDR